jgi:putative transposase
MGLPRSTYYDAASREADDGDIVATMIAICDEFEAYGYRRVGAELRHRGIVVNSKKNPPSHARARPAAQAS